MRYIFPDKIDEFLYDLEFFMIRNFVIRNFVIRNSEHEEFSASGTLLLGTLYLYPKDSKTHSVRIP
jgi:hypothetical protein